MKDLELKKCMRRLFRIGFETALLQPTSSFRELPDFLVIGAQKAATSSLDAAFRRHPNCFGAWRKETHFFDHNFHRGVWYYRRFFPLAHTCRRRMGKIGVRPLVCEASPDYLFHPLAAERVRSTLGEVPLIVILRNPVTRAVSQYYHNMRVAGVGREPLKIDEAFRSEESRLNGIEEKLRSGSIRYSSEYFFRGYLARGQYARQLDRYGSWWQNNRLLVLCYENLITDPVTNLEEIAKFLGIPTWQQEDFPKANVGLPVGKISKDTIRFLIEQFDSSNQRLREVYDFDTSGWEIENRKLLQVSS